MDMRSRVIYLLDEVIQAVPVCLQVPQRTFSNLRNVLGVLLLQYGIYSRPIRISLVSLGSDDLRHFRHVLHCRCKEKGQAH
jgi:hypothetical protein